jgi:hypothetical protein
VIHRLVILAALAAAPFALAPASAAIVPDTAMVPLFVEACTAGTPGAEAIEARMDSDGAWTRVADTDLAVEEFGATEGQMTEFRKPTGYKQWRRSVDGKEVRVVLASFGEKARYRTICALLVPDVKNALPYWDNFRDAMKTVGLKGKSVNLVHFQEFSGKLADGRKARGEMFSRSGVLADKSMHMYIAF